jgi:hypothetical protein
VITRAALRNIAQHSGLWVEGRSDNANRATMSRTLISLKAKGFIGMTDALIWPLAHKESASNEGAQHAQHSATFDANVAGQSARNRNTSPLGDVAGCDAGVAAPAAGGERGGLRGSDADAAPETATPQESVAEAAKPVQPEPDYAFQSRKLKQVVLEELNYPREQVAEIFRACGIPRDRAMALWEGATPMGSNEGKKLNHVLEGRLFPDG